MCAGPPGNGEHALVLHPHQQQQQTENDLDVDGEQEQRVDFKRHSSWPTAQTGNTPLLLLASQALQTVKVSFRLRADKIMVSAKFTARECRTAHDLGARLVRRAPNENRRKALAIAPMS